MRPRHLLLIPALLLGMGPAHPAGAVPTSSSIASNFNGTAIPAGRTIWFNSVASYSGPTSAPVTIYVRNAVITFTANSINYSLPVPDADITYSPSLPLAATTFNTGTSTWQTTAAFGSSGNQFLSGLSFNAGVALPGGINPVTWSADFSSDTPGVCLQWKWAAAVYTSFSTDNNALGVKPIDANTGSAYSNSDHSGTPENFKSFVTGGARGGGGSNATGSLSGTVTVCPGLVVPALTTTWGGVKAREF